LRTLLSLDAKELKVRDSQDEIIEEGRQNKLIREYMDSLGPKLNELVEGHKNAQALINALSQWIEDNQEEYKDLMQKSHYPVENICVRVTTENRHLMENKDQLIVGLESALALGYFLAKNPIKD
jgi:hypothetical protein